jgi:uncharacterized repeat protein (TIGR03803 family)
VALGCLLTLVLIAIELAKAQTYTVRLKFHGSPANGAGPHAPLAMDGAGNLYGTTWGGGAANAGTAFRLDKTGETVLYSFSGGADGRGPGAGLVMDSAGNLYGTTINGGASGAGVVFKLDIKGAETVLYSFTGGADGAHPYAGLIRDPEGNMYGTTFEGGAPGCGSLGCGVVFKLDPAGTETVLPSQGETGRIPMLVCARTRRVIYTGSLPKVVHGGAVSYSSWIPAAPRLSCTASQAPPMDILPKAL